MKNCMKLERLMNKATSKARVLKNAGFSNSSIRNILKQYGADTKTIEMIMIAI